jgi:hypothetical protein
MNNKATRRSSKCEPVLALNAQMIELHRHKVVLGMVRATTIDYTKA